MQPSGRTCFWCFNHFKHNNPARDKSRSSSELERVFPRNLMRVLWNIIWGFVVRLYAVRLLTCKPSRNARSDSFALEMAAGLFARLIMLPFCRLVLRRAIRPRFFRWLARSALIQDRVAQDITKKVEIIGLLKSSFWGLAALP